MVEDKPESVARTEGFISDIRALLALRFRTSPAKKTAMAPAMVKTLRPAVKTAAAGAKGRLKAKSELSLKKAIRAMSDK